MASIPYCEAEGTLIKSLWRQGKTAKVIAEASNARFRRARTRNSIIGYINRAGLSGRVQTPRAAAIGAKAQRGRIALAARKASPKKPAAPPAKKLKGGAVTDAARRANDARARTGRKTPAPAPEKPRPAAPPVLKPPKRLGVLELTDRVCRYPVTDDLPHQFCGHPVLKGKVYCGAHHAVIVAKPSEEAA